MGPEDAGDFARAREIGAKHLGAFGHAPEVVSFAPGRVNLMGDHTDYNGGAVLPIAIDLGTVCAVARRDDGVLHIVSYRADGVVHSIDVEAFDRSADNGWLGYVVGCVITAAENGWWTGGLDMSIDGDLPLGAGLSSSASLECAVLTALVGLNAVPVDLWSMALTAQRVEHDYAHVPCGIMDQATAMLAQRENALLLDTATGDTAHVSLRLDLLGLEVFLVDTNAHHELTDGGYANRRAACEAAARQLGVAHLAELTEADVTRIAGLPAPLATRARHVVTEHARVARTTDAFERSDADELGRLFAESHRSLASDFEVSCEELDLAAAASIAAGARAARMTGAGFGGSVVTLCPTNRLDPVQAAVRVAFADRGLAEPSFLLVRPSAGARLIYRSVA